MRGKRVGTYLAKSHKIANRSMYKVMLKQDVHPKVVQERLGHANISTTLDTYSHVAPELQEAATKGFDEVLNRESKIDKQLAEIIHN